MERYGLVIKIRLNKKVLNLKLFKGEVKLLCRSNVKLAHSKNAQRNTGGEYQLWLYICFLS